MIRLTLVAALAALSLVPAAARAQGDCWSDAAGGVQCRDDQGGSSGQAGASMWRDEDGDVVKGYSDGEGNSVYRDSHGNVVTGHTDGQGNSIWRDSEGRTVTGHSEPTGDTSYKDKSGRTVHCKSYGYGRKICR